MLEFEQAQTNLKWSILSSDFQNICLIVLGSKQPWEILVFVIFKFRIICSCSNFLKYMENFEYRSILVDSGSIVHWIWEIMGDSIFYPKTGQSRWWHTLRLSLVFSDFNFRTFLRKLSVHPVERSPLTNSAWNWNLKSLTRPQHSHCAIIDFGRWDCPLCKWPTMTKIRGT